LSGSPQMNTFLRAMSNRRRFLQAAGALGTAAALDFTRMSPPSVAAQDGSTLVFLASDGAYSLDPAENWDYGGGATIISHVYEGLFKFTGADKVVLEPNLALEVPSVENGGISEDGLTYTVKLKPNAYFHDGNPVNAEAVVFSYERTRKLKFGVDFLLDQIDTITAVDDLTVQFKLKKPFSAFLSSISGLWGNSIVSPETVLANSTSEEDFGHEYLLFNDAGSGGYILESYDPDQKQAVLVRDPNWWQGWSDGPHLDRVVILWISEAATIRSMLERGDAHVVANLTPEDWEALSNVEGITTIEAPASLQCEIVLNNAKPPLDNPKVRQALAYAFNYEQAIEGIMGGHAVKLDSVVTPMSLGYAPASTQYTFDLDKAKALLEEAGLGDGFTFELYALHLFLNDQLLLEMYQADLAKIGVTLDVKVMDSNAFLGQHLSGNIDDSFMGFIGNIGPDFPDAYNMLAGVYAEDSQPPAFCCNFEFYSSPKMEEILVRIEGALDPEERQAAIQEGFDLAFEEVGVIWVFNFKQLIGMRSNVQGWEFNFLLGANYAPFEKMSLA
jgi:peptide/nickel transport system substrate-binding protein